MTLTIRNIRKNKTFLIHHKQTMTLNLVYALNPQLNEQETVLK